MCRWLKLGAGFATLLLATALVSVPAAAQQAAPPDPPKLDFGFITGQAAPSEACQLAAKDPSARPGTVRGCFCAAGVGTDQVNCWGKGANCTAAYDSFVADCLYAAPCEDGGCRVQVINSWCQLCDGSNPMCPSGMYMVDGYAYYRCLTCTGGGPCPDPPCEV